MSIYDLLARVPDWPLVTERTARVRERNAFEIGRDVGRDVTDRPAAAAMDCSQRNRRRLS